MDKPFTLLLLLFPCILLPFLGKIPEPDRKMPAHLASPLPPQPAQASCNCTVTQGSFSSPLPFMSSNTNANTFYAYGNPIGASANTGLEMSETMLIMLYEDNTTGNTSLIVILDLPNDGTGGNANILFECMPAGSFVGFSDDAGELTGTAPTFTGNFNWAPCCTDGGVIGGVGCGSTFTINPNINSGITAFSLVYGTPAFPTYVNMPEINCPITINCGGTSCCQGAFEFTGSAQSASCGNTADGAINLTTDCAAGPTFAWSNGATTEDVSGLLPGNYTVTITDANNCSQSATYVVGVANPNPTPTIAGPTQYCAGETVQLDAVGGYSSYAWSNGSTGTPIFVSSPGTYTVTATSAAGCTGTASTTLTQIPLPAPNITGPPAVCMFYDQITLNAGAGFASYQWSTGDFTPTINVTQFGTYYVTVTNSFGCVGVDFHIVAPLTNPAPFIVGPNNICAGVPIGLDAGNGYSSYLWSNGFNTQAITAFIGGSYTVTVSNSGGCTGSASHDVTEYQADSTLLFQTSCDPQEVGTFIQIWSNQYGCDSVVTLTVSLSEADTIYFSSQSCDPQDVGTFVQTFPNQHGCDSVEIETVTLLPSNSVSLLEYSCSPQDTGVVVQSLTNQYGCDSVVTTTTLLLPSNTVHIQAQSCNPTNAGVTQVLLVNSDGCDSLVITTTTYSLSDTTYLQGYTCDINQAGQSEAFFTNSEGCDSLVITTILFNLSDTTYLSANTCDINQAGQSEALFTNQAGCDSLVITNTIFISADTTQLALTSCNPGDVGVFQNVLTNSYGCDSVLITTVSLLPTDTTALFDTSCDPNLSGVQEMLLTNQYGCDSLVIITTSYALSDSTYLTSTTCDPSAAGVFEVLLTSADGCDSLMTTTVVLQPTDTVYVNTTSCNPANVGVTQNLLANQYGCDSLVITTTALLPSDTTYLQAITCNSSQVGISQSILPNQYGCDSLIITNTTFIPPDTTFLFAQSCNPGQVGTVTVYLQNSFGCDSLIITTTLLLPSDTTVIQAYSCNPSQVGTTQVHLTNQYGCDSLIITNTAQLQVDTTLTVLGTCSVLDTGLVATLLTNQFGCDSLVLQQTNLLPAASCQLTAQILGDTIGCPETVGSFWLTFLDGMAPYAYTWTNQSGNTGSGFINQGGTPQPVGGLLPGAYTFQILDADGLMTTLSAVIFQPNPIQIDLQESSDFNGYGISCFGASDGVASVSVLSGGLPPHAISWSNGSQTTQANNLTGGWTSVTVTDVTGCVTIDSVFLDSPDNLQFSLSVANPDCFTDEVGAIAITQVVGGSSPYQYSLNGSAWQAAPLFGGLGSGSYQIAVEDANDCTASSYAFINSFIQPVVTLGPDIILEYGESMVLKAITNLPFALLDSIYWAGLDCPDCPNVTIAPLVASNYSVTVVDSLGCSASDDLKVVVKKNFPVYIPNAFSPDSDGINDVFLIYSGPHLIRIREFQIFDRWGETIFTYFNIPPNNPAYGWNGTHRDKLLDAGVFVYYALLEFVDGSTELVKGDVVLMR
jgi:gliding motility-associated-like protein